jgi:hypothetical protein
MGGREALHDVDPLLWAGRLGVVLGASTLGHGY